MNVKLLKTSLIITCVLLLSFESNAQEHFYLKSGDEYYQKGEFDKARNAYLQVRTFTGFYNAANASYQSNNFQDATQWYVKALQLPATNGQKSNAWYNLGNSYLRLNKYREAASAFENSLYLQSNRADAKKNLQIAREHLQTPPPTPPPPPPPPPSNPRRSYVDQSKQNPNKELPRENIPPGLARQLLAKAVEEQEEKNAQEYRALAPSRSPSRLKKDW